jgi:3-dehydroquinate synthase class II
VHAYVAIADGSTSYLSEMHTGSQVLAVDAQGRSRTVIVGRVKIETRPLLLVEVEVAGQRHSVLLQNSETVCLATSQGESGWRFTCNMDLKLSTSISCMLFILFCVFYT